MAYCVIKSGREVRVEPSWSNNETSIYGSISKPPEPLASADSKEEAVELAYSHIENFPADILYIVGPDRNVLDIALDQNFQDALNATKKSRFILFACCSLATLGLLVSLVGGLGAVGIIFSIVSISLYLILVKTGIFNEVESLVACIIFAILAVMLLPAIQTFPQRPANAG